VSRLPEPTLEQGFRIAYVAGLVLCLGWPLALQLMLGTVIRRLDQLPPAGAIQQLGYTFTGLTLVIALFVTWRWGKVRAGFHRLAPERRGLALLREIILYSALFEFTSLFGVLYFALGGPEADRYARSFIALTTVMFFVFVPRLQAWRDAAQGE
jgi:hypothetical protein